ncbi:hypothetical protein MTO96_007637 [Rhipicephalus appendiculatus]
MVPAVHPFAVCGFSENLDWSTLDFVKPIDDIRVCSACGIVARKTAFLPCRHVLCEPCYKQWKPRIKVCFLDGELCPENEVYWMEFPEKKMMTREVRCWNRRNGCETITDVSSIAEHFHRDCAYHSTCCPKCSSTVLRRDITAHLESNCANYVLDRKSRRPHSEDVSKDVQRLQESIRALESAFRSGSQTDGSLLSRLEGIGANNEDNHNPLLSMAGEVEQVSQMTRQVLSEVERSSGRRANQRVELKNFEVRLCADLDEIKSAADERWSSERVSSHENIEHEKCVDNLELLQRELRSITRELEEVKNKAERKNLSKHVQCLQEGICGLESTFRNASQNDASLLPSLRGITGSNDENQNPPVTILDEVKQLSQVTRQSLSERERRSARSLNQRVDLRNFGAKLCAELDETRRTTDEGCTCHACKSHEIMERQIRARNLELLRREVQNISINAQRKALLRKFLEGISPGIMMARLLSILPDKTLLN